MIDKPTAMQLLRTMLLIRECETRLEEVYWQFEFGGELHLSIGQEAIAAGVCCQLRQTDSVESTHRAHGHFIAKGGDLNRMIAELYGKATGLSKGKGGHMHIFDPNVRFGCSGIVGASIPIALGHAFAAKYRGSNDIAVAFFGDGAVNEGAFHESMNLAAVLRLPVLFICEDNHYSISTKSEDVTAGPSIAARADGYGIPAITADGNAVEEVYTTAELAIEHLRNGEGPFLIVFETFRMSAHFCGDSEVYKPDEEQELWESRDPIPRYQTRLTDLGKLSEDEFVVLQEEVGKTVTDALEFARASPYPEPETACDDIFASTKPGPAPTPPAVPTITPKGGEQ